MKLLSATTASVVITGTQALASAGGTDALGMGLLATFFIAFAVMIVLFQFLPGLALFLGMLKGIFSSEAEKRAREAAKENSTSL